VSEPVSEGTPTDDATPRGPDPEESRHVHFLDDNASAEEKGEKYGELWDGDADDVAPPVPRLRRSDTSTVGYTATETVLNPATLRSLLFPDGLREEAEMATDLLPQPTPYHRAGNRNFDGIGCILCRNEMTNSIPPSELEEKYLLREDLLDLCDTHYACMGNSYMPRVLSDAEEASFFDSEDKDEPPGWLVRDVNIDLGEHPGHFYWQD